MFNEHFERPTIVYCIVDTVYTVLASINSVILKQHANQKKRSKSNVTCTKLYGGKII